MELKTFEKVYGIDPSSNMIDMAQQNLASSDSEQLEFRQSQAEELSFLKDSSVDLIISGV